MNRLAILAIPVVLSGCGIPPAVTIASYALDGAVLAASGKTVRDHALSTVVRQDCSMFRVISGEPICIDYEPNDPAAAALEEMPAAEEMLTATSDGRVIRVAATPSGPDTPVVANAVPALPGRALPEGDSDSASAARESTLLTTADGREIRVMAQDLEPGAGDSSAPPVQLSWVPPVLVPPHLH